MSEPGGSSVVDIGDIQKMLTEAEASLSDKRCIYKVPQRLLKLKEDAYTPKVVSIGPLHHGSPNLRNGEREKRIFLKKFIRRLGPDLDNNLDRLARFVESLEPEVRVYYSEKFDLAQKELVEIILVDAGFLLELLIWYRRRDWERNELPSLNSWLLSDVQGDLLLLENQLPFLVLDMIFTFARPEKIKGSLLELPFNMFWRFNLQNVDPTFAEMGVPLHFNDLLRLFYLQPESDRLRDEPSEEELVYSVTDLHEAGVKLKARESPYLLDLKFSDGALEIPPLTVDDSTELLFRNILALEQCHYRCKSYVTECAVILDCLINKESDVEVLVKKKIVRSLLGENNDVAKLINGLGKEIVISNRNPNYSHLSKELNIIGKKSWRITKATFRRRYFKTPWHTAASVAASLILIFTFTQTVCSLYQVTHGH